MKEYYFPAWIKLGKHDSRETIVSHPLTDREAEQLRQVTMQEDHESFYMCDALSGIYKIVHFCVADQIESTLQEFSDEEGGGMSLADYKYFIEFPDDLTT